MIEAELDSNRSKEIHMISLKLRQFVPNQTKPEWDAVKIDLINLPNAASRVTVRASTADSSRVTRIRCGKRRVSAEITHLRRIE